MRDLAGLLTDEEGLLLTGRVVNEVVKKEKAWLEAGEPLRGNTAELEEILLVLAQKPLQSVKDIALQGLVVAFRLARELPVKADGESANHHICRLLLVLTEASDESVQVFALHGLIPLVDTDAFTELLEDALVVPRLERLLRGHKTRRIVSDVVRRIVTNDEYIDIDRVQSMVTAGGVPIILELARSRDAVICADIVFALDAILLKREPAIKGAPKLPPLTRLTPEQCFALSFSRHAGICRLGVSALAHLSGMPLSVSLSVSVCLSICVTTSVSVNANET